MFLFFYNFISVNCTNNWISRSFYKDFYIAIYRMEDLAHIYAMTGEYELALERLDELLSMPGNISANLIRKDPTWKPLWSLPEFQEMLEKYVN